jgi:DMSO/TMAO reductase YedYZ molybdopterin-dependent catalytic subunit
VAERRFRHDGNDARVVSPNRVDRGDVMAPVSRGFHGRRRPVADPSRVPPGQYVTGDFPVLSAGPTPHTPLTDWTFAISGAIDEPVSWSWEEFTALPAQTVTVDIHCVTKWSKLDTSWKGVAVDTLLEGVTTAADFLTAWCDGGYTTNLSLEDVRDGRAWVAYQYGDEPLASEHGGPARLLVPHLYFWKSAKWVRGLTLTFDDEPGFWENYGYHNHGDPWLEQRYQGD